MAPEYLSVTERWIRRKVNLHHNCLADVRSLCLPGTYEGKIRRLGNSLKNFVRLKSLDLSHNALVSVEGIQHLQMLEVLNLYYNNISSLKDVLFLCKLKALRELDLRLNPIVRNTPDYRLYLVHALPNLRKLDDCPVRDSERKVSIQHFPTDAMFDKGQVADFPPGRSKRSSQPRTALVNRMVEKRCFLDDNDEAVLNLVAKGNLDLSEPLKSSTNKQPECQLYDLLEEYGNFRKDDCQIHADNFRYTKQDSAKFILRHSPEIKTKHQCGTEPQVTDLGEGGRVLRTDKGPRVTFIDPVHMSQELDPIISEAPVRIAAHGTFTPVPADPPSASIPSASPVMNRPSRVTNQGGWPSDCPRPSSAPGAKSKDRQLWKTFGFTASLVDQHWRGETSLQRNRTFLVEAVRILSGMEQDASGPREEVKSLKANIENLNTQRQREAKEHQSEAQRLTRQLEQAQSSIEELNQQLKDLLEENLSLQRRLIKSDQRLLDSRMDRVPEAVEDRSTAEGVRREVEELKERLQQAEKVQELADMLKESHRSLLRNNKCLVVELEETRTRHRSALEQLDRRFCELSRTVSLVPETCKRKT